MTCDTGRLCGYHPADVRRPETLTEAVSRCIRMFGRIDFVVCGEFDLHTAFPPPSLKCNPPSGAAGNFLSTIDNLSENGFRTVIEIDTMGTYNTVKVCLIFSRTMIKS